MAAKYLAKDSAERHRRVILVVSDGDDNFSNTVKDLSVAEARAELNGETTPASQRVSLQNRHQKAVQEVEHAIQRADITFYSINPGGPSIRLNQISMRAQSGMAAMADATGGAAFVPDTEKGLQPVFDQVAAELRGQTTQVVVGESGELGSEGQQRQEQGVAADLAELEAGDLGAGAGENRVEQVM